MLPLQLNACSLICWGCRNKVPQTGELNKQEITSCSSGTRVQGQSVKRFGLLQGTPCACRQSVPVSSQGVSLWCLFLGSSFLFSSGHCEIRLGSLVTSVQLITLLEALSPSAVTFSGTNQLGLYRLDVTGDSSAHDTCFFSLPSSLPPRGSQAHISIRGTHDQMNLPLKLPRFRFQHAWKQINEEVILPEVEVRRW